MATIMACSADVARYLAFTKTCGFACFETLDVAAARALYLAGRDTTQLPDIAIGTVIDDSVAGREGAIPVRRYLPPAFGKTAQPVILFFHGGGWVIGDLDSHDSICRHIVRATGMQVIAIDYRLAPEHPFPAAVEDAIDAHAMLLEHAAAWSIDPRCIALMGDGVGGTLASIVSLHARDMCRPMPFAQVMVYPAADLAYETDSFRRVADVPMTGRTMRWFRDLYLTDPAAAADWRVSPHYAKSLAGLPPSQITIAGLDPFHDEGAAFAERLRTFGVPVELRDLPDQIHGYLMAGRMISEAETSIAAAAEFLKAQLG